MILQSLSKSGLGLVTRPGLVVMRTLTPLTVSVEQSLRTTVMAKGGGEMFGRVSVASQPCLGACYNGWLIGYDWLIWWRWDILFVMLQKFIFNRRRMVWL